MRAVWVASTLLLLCLSLFSVLQWRSEAKPVEQPSGNVVKTDNTEEISRLEDEVKRLAERRAELEKDLDGLAVPTSSVPTDSKASCLDRPQNCGVVIAIAAHTKRKMVGVTDAFPVNSDGFPQILADTALADFAVSANYHYARLRGYDFVEVDFGQGVPNPCRGVEGASALLAYYQVVVFLGPHAYARESAMDVSAVVSDCPAKLLVDVEAAARGPSVLVARRSSDADALLADWRKTCASQQVDDQWRSRLCQLSVDNAGPNGALFVRGQDDSDQAKAAAIEATSLHSLRFLDCQNASTVTCVLPDYRPLRATLAELRARAGGGAS